MPQPILGGKLLESVCAAIGVDSRMARRVVLDVKYNDVVLAYVELIGCEELLEVDFSSVPIKIVTTQKDGK